MVPRATDNQHYISGNDVKRDWRTPTQGTLAGNPVPEQPPHRDTCENVFQFPTAPMYTVIQANSGYPPAAETQHWGYHYGPLVGATYSVPHRLRVH